MRLAATCLSQHLFAREQAQLDADAREPDALAAGFPARCEVMVASQLAARHAGAVVHDAQRPPAGIGREHDRRRAGVERVRHDLARDRLLE